MRLQRINPPLLGLLLIQSGLGRRIIGVGLLDLQTQIGVVEPGQRVALPHHRAGVDKALRHLAGNTEGEVAFDSRFDDAGQHAIARARRIMNLRHQDRALGRLSPRLGRGAARGEQQSGQQSEGDRAKLHDAYSGL